MPLFRASYFGLLYMLAIMNLVSSQDAARLILSPETEMVTFENTIFMTCVADGNDLVFSWSLNGNPINSNVNEGFVISAMNVSQDNMTFLISTLEVCSVGIDDVGEYSCTVANSVGDDTSSWNISIAGSEEAEVIVASESLTLSRFGGTIAMTCAAGGFPPPEISFQKDGIAISDDGSDIMIFEEDDQLILAPGAPGINFTVVILVICNIRMDNIGNYSCIANNGVGDPDSLTWSLSIEPTAPEFVMEPSDDSVEYNSTDSVSCVASGYPFPTIEFTKDGNSIDTVNGASVTSGRSYIDQESGLLYTQSDLTVQDIGETELGTYSCTATNSQGTISTSWNIRFVRDLSPPVVMAIPDEEHEVEYGNTVLMPCVYDGYPQPEIVFVRNDTTIVISELENVKISHNMAMLNGTHFTLSVLEVCSVGINDVGNYSCMISNFLGNETHSWNLDFDRELEPSERLNSTSSFNGSEIEHGSSILLTCYGNGYPLAEISWIKETTVLTESDRLNITSRIRTEENGEKVAESILEILDLNEQDSGTYICEVANVLSVERFEFLVEVLPAPTTVGPTSTDDTTKKVVEGDSDKSRGVIIGGAVGGVVAAIILCALVIGIVVAIFIIVQKSKSDNYKPNSGGSAKLITNKESDAPSTDPAKTDTLKFESFEKKDLSYDNPVAIEEGFGVSNPATENIYTNS